MIDHVTYAVSGDELVDPRWEEFFRLLDMRETEPDPVIEKDYNVRWFRDANGLTVHLVEVPGMIVRTPMEHFCVKHVGSQRLGWARQSRFIVRDSGSGRIWLRGPSGIRVEVHP